MSIGDVLALHNDDFGSLAAFQAGHDTWSDREWPGSHRMRQQRVRRYEHLVLV